HPHRLHRRRRPGQARSCVQPWPTGWHLTGINFLIGELTAKRLGLLCEFVPGAARIAVLVNPANATNVETTLRDVEPAALAMGLQIQILKASTSSEIEAAFATFVRERPDALFVGNDAFFTSRSVQLVHLATLHKVPATYALREFVEVGGHREARAVRKPPGTQGRDARTGAFVFRADPGCGWRRRRFQQPECHPYRQVRHGHDRRDRRRLEVAYRPHFSERPETDGTGDHRYVSVGRRNDQHRRIWR